MSTKAGGAVRRAVENAATRALGRHELFDGAVDAILVTAADGTLVDMNPAAEALFSWKLDDVVNRQLAELAPRLAPLLPPRKLSEACRTAGGVVVEVQKGNHDTIRVHIATIESVTGSEVGYLFVVRDSVPIERAQQRTLRAERLGAIGEAMTALAHECRNALQRMQSCLTLLKLRGDEGVQALVDDMQDAQEQLQRLYEEVRSFAAPLALQRHRTDVRKLVERVWRQLRLRWSKKGLHFELRLESSVDPRCSADPRLLGRALRSVVENAIEASPRGGTVYCTLADAPGSGPRHLSVSIEDTGPGLGAEAKDRAFDLLYTTKEGGTGMGLSNARRIVGEHHGEIRLEGRESGGTRAVIELPYEDGP